MNKIGTQKKHVACEDAAVAPDECELNGNDESARLLRLFSLPSLENDLSMSPIVFLCCLIGIHGVDREATSRVKCKAIGFD